MAQNKRKVKEIIEKVVQLSYWRGLYIGALMINFVFGVIYGFQEKFLHIFIGVITVIGAIVMILLYRYWVKELKKHGTKE